MSDARERPGADVRADGAPMFSHLLASRPKRQGRMAAFATTGSLVTHGLLVAGLVWATAAAGAHDEKPVQEVVTMVIPVDEPPPPPPPPPPPEEAPPPAEMPDVPQGFLTLEPPEVVLSEIPPPALTATNVADFSGTGVEGGRADGRPVSGEGSAQPSDLSAAPVFTPYTVAPDLRNRAAVARTLERNYPPLLRDAGIGGQVVVWIYIDEQGRVVKSQIHTPSGYESLDAAALKVSQSMEFRPARNRDRTVPVWVSIPITFTSR